MIRFELPDGAVKEFSSPVAASEVVRSISEGLLRAAVCVSVDGELLGLNEILDKGGSFKVLTFKDEEGKEVYRHTASHVLAQAIKRLYPDAKLAIGPAVKTGFYYDIDFSRPITLDDFKAIEEEMNKIVKSDFAVEKSVVSVERAKEMLADEPYKLELLEGIKDETVTFFTQGEFSDMCRGPHLSSTGKLKAFRLTSIAGAYWRGDSSKKMLTRIYGTAFDKKSEMEEFLARVEEAKKRDHNKLGRELGIFMTEENIGQGLPLFMPKGAHILKTMQRWVEDEEEKRGYMITKTPFMAKSDLYKISGHWYHYRDAMFILGNPEEADVNKEVLALRPMTCPFQFMIYKNGLKSYRDLPVRYNETAPLFRNENSGEMHGMIRVRQFTLSDGHIICRPDQIEQEFLGVLDLIRYFMKTLGLENDVSYRFSRWDPENNEKYIDNPEAWENSERLMKKILDDAGVNYYEAVGEAAFYGPKLDVQSVNVYGKEDTLFTIQIDFELAERFDMSYVDADGNKKRPFIVHRSSIGCYERTLALLIEKYNGALPAWMMYTQVKVLSLTDRTAAKTEEITAALRLKGIRAEVDNRSEKVGFKIREAQLEKIPYMLVVGDKEAAENKVSVRHRSKGDLGLMSLDEFSARILAEIKEKVID